MNRTSHKTLWGIGDAIVIVVALVPVLWLASLSFKDPSTIADGSFLPQKWTLANYRGVFQTSLFTRALVNSIGIAVIATVLAVVIGSLAAYAVARLRFPGKGLLVAAALLIAMFPWDLERAARVDGATPFQAFTRVIAPLATPGIVTTPHHHHLRLHLPTPDRRRADLRRSEGIGAGLWPTSCSSISPSGSPTAPRPSTTPT